MNNLLPIIFFPILIEAVLTAIFAVVNLQLDHEKKPFRASSWLKGFIERAFLVFALLAGFENALILFAAIKLGTRLNSDTESKISNDYFLIGNLISIAAAILHVKVISMYLPIS